MLQQTATARLEEEGSQIHITHMKVTSFQRGENTGPWRKGNIQLQGLGKLLGDGKLLYGRQDGRLAGVYA